MDSYDGPERRQGQSIEDTVAQAVREALGEHRLISAEDHEAHHQYLAAVIEREAKRAKRWDAIIEKSLAGVVWSALAYLFHVALDPVVTFVRGVFK